MANKKPITVNYGGTTQGKYANYQYGTIPNYTSQYDKKSDKTMKKIEKYGTYKSTLQPDIDKYKNLVVNPEAFNSKWGDYVDKYGQLLDKEYDPNSDASYQAYKNQYLRGGQKAMQDTLAQAAALTGGYGSSYGQSVAQQTYNDYTAALADKIPELAQAAQEMYMNKLGAYSNLYNQDWNMYNDNRNYNSTVLGQLMDMDNTYYNRFEDGRNNLYNMLNAYQGLSDRDYNRFQNEYSMWSKTYDALDAAAKAASSGGGGGRRGGSGGRSSGSSGSSKDYDLVEELRYANSQGASPYDMWAYAQDQVKGANDLIKQTGLDPAGLVHQIQNAYAKRKK